MPTYAENMVDKYETLLTANAGLKQVSVDGQVVSFADLEASYEFWTRRVAREAGTKPLIVGVNLSGGT